MGQVKEININNRTYYFFNDMIKLKKNREKVVEKR